jgi:hypothetical protein
MKFSLYLKIDPTHISSRLNKTAVGCAGSFGAHTNFLLPTSVRTRLPVWLSRCESWALVWFWIPTRFLGHCSFRAGSALSACRASGVIRPRSLHRLARPVSVVLAAVLDLSAESPAAWAVPCCPRLKLSAGFPSARSWFFCRPMFLWACYCLRFSRCLSLHIR